MKKYQKNKKKKRFGKSLNNNSPGKFINELKQKLEYFEIELEEINTQKMKASQYNHDTNTCIKVPLSQRGKLVDGQWVQRDLYSAFIVQNRKDKETVDRAKCEKGFKKFLEIQNRIIENLKKRGDDLPKCMGIL